jgi:hypothetical protein
MVMLQKVKGQVCACADTLVYLFVGVADVWFLTTVTIACAKRTGAAASVERRRREPARAAPILFAHAHTLLAYIRHPYLLDYVCPRICIFAAVVRVASKDGAWKQLCNQLTELNPRLLHVISLSEASKVCVYVCVCACVQSCLLDI